MLAALAGLTMWTALGAQAGGARVAPPKDQETRRSLHDAEQLKTEQTQLGKAAADRAQRAAERATRLSEQRVAAAARLQQADAAVLDASLRIDALARQRREAEAAIRSRTAAMQPLLPLIERLSLYPAETMLAMPEPPEQTLRGVMVLKALSRQVELQAEALRRNQADLDAVSAALRAEAPNLAEARAAQAREAQSLDQQIATAHAEQSKAEAEESAAASQAALSATRADTLRAALTALETQQRAEAARAQADAERAERQSRTEAGRAARQHEDLLTGAAFAGQMASGEAPNRQLQPPVIGVLVRAWGEPTDAGPATGMSYHAPPGAGVISPCGGRVVFAEVFRSYGLLLIVDCGGGYHVVLAGFERLDVKLGQRLLAGEPVGVMPTWQPGSAAHRPSLYVELRHNGQPVNPAPWLRSSS